MPGRGAWRCGGWKSGGSARLLAAETPRPTGLVGKGLPACVAPPGNRGRVGRLPWKHIFHKESDMPIILWLLGVPIVVIVLLMLFGVL
jgi:hypothetical protein